MVVKVEVLYAPTCAGMLMWLERIRKALADFGGDVVVEEIDILKHPETLRRYPSPEWSQFLNGHIHYFTVVAINGRASEDWYWDTAKIAQLVRNELEKEKAQR